MNLSPSHSTPKFLNLPLFFLRCPLSTIFSPSLISLASTWLYSMSGSFQMQEYGCQQLRLTSSQLSSLRGSFRSRNRNLLHPSTRYVMTIPGSIMCPGKRNLMFTPHWLPHPHLWPDRKSRGIHIQGKVVGGTCWATENNCCQRS